MKTILSIAIGAQAMLVNDVMNDMARHFGEDAYLPEF